ncbi:hypothetical protein F5X68DRAFT_16996 [Plectosphaerella plurivora]|uniref:Uncharacterized protein n=1 Tax=Plectosphaerella plurivora TaxID=936078 RepID=A0A9P8V9Z4_9PEZI|nr:hypothetical protein F5X68DRAFT_16996 [Plectosphaerella plurivora]
MLTTATSRAPPGARVLQTARASPTALLRAAGPSSRLSLLGQTRQFRFVRGTESTEPESQVHRRLRCRHNGGHKYRYVGAMSRKLSWGHNLGASEHKTSTKTTVLGRYWDSMGQTGQYIDVDKIQSWSDEHAGPGVRPGRNIEDVERNAINDLFHGHSDNAAPYKYDHWLSPFENIRNYMSSQHAEEKSAKSPGRKASKSGTPSSDGLATIDPITNRRVIRQHATDASASGPASVSPPTSRIHFTLPQSLSGNAEKVHSNGPPPPEELQKYKPVMHKGLDSAAFETRAAADAVSSKGVYSDASKYDAFKWLEPNGQYRKSHEELSKEYKDLDKYGPIKWRESVGAGAAFARQASKKPAETDQYGPMRWREPAGLPKLSAEEQSKQYEDVHEYTAVQFNEPEGQLQPTLEEHSRKYKDLAEYKAIRFNEAFAGRLPPTTEERSKEYEDLEEYNPVRFNEAMAGRLPPTAEEQSQVYEDLEQYQPVAFNEAREGQLPTTAEERSKQYNDLAKYEPVAFNEALDGQLPSTAEELSKQYQDVDKYEPVAFNEAIDGKMPPTAEELSKRYKDIDQYGPVSFNEPDGQIPLHATEPATLPKYEPLILKVATEGKLSPTVEELAKQYTDLHKYEAVTFNETIDGKLPQTAEELSKQYTDLGSYGPVMWNEPDGQLPPSPELLSKQYGDLSYYTPVQFNEANGGKLPLTTEEKSKKYGDLHQYTPVGFNEASDGKLPPTVEEASKQYDDLQHYTPVQFNEPDGQLPVTSEEQSNEYRDLDHYTPVRFNEPDGMLPTTPEEISKEYQDLGQYEPVKWNEPDGKPTFSAEEKTKQYKDLKEYSDPVQWNEPNGQAPERPEETGKQYEDLDKYEPVAWNEPDGKPPMPAADEGVPELDKYEPVKWNEPSGKTSQHPEEGSKQYKDLDGYTGPFTHQEPDGKPVVSQKSFAGQERPLTGNYSRDFPEEFAVSWSPMLGQSASARPEKDAEDFEIASFDESFPSLNESFPAPSRKPFRLQPALDRASGLPGQRRLDKVRPQADQYSMEPQGLQLSFMEEMGGQRTLPTYARMYGTASDASATAGAKTSAPPPSSSGSTFGKGGSEGSAAEPPDTSHYKILAYDPTMQSISTAETTSIVKDNSAPLTPAEVMMRLSNPIKFFPHLGPLQAEGYDIVSGSGDVLVFRKVREAAAPVPEKATIYQPPRVNPIDMMGSQPVTPHSYSASPTGYLNYDDGAETEVSTKPLPPFREQTFAQAQQKSKPDPAVQTKPKKSRKAKKVLVGAASVGGLSYAVGVVGEFFKTGGSDGKGPPTRF